MREVGAKPITTRSLNRLKFLDACTKESQRLNPPLGGFLPREIQRPTVIRGYQVPPGTLVLLNQVTLNQMHVPSPAEFVPERWIRGSKHPLANSVPKFGHLVFGYGRRQCPGRRLAEAYMNVLIVKMLKEFRVEYHEQPFSSSIKKMSGLIQPAESFKLRLIKRNK